MKNRELIIKNANENNLKNVNLKIPHGKLVVVTGLSGSGKSSLVFDVVFAEGQRRYLQGMSTYARQFFGQISKPDVDEIEGLCPTLAIDQKTTYKSPRSTVGTITEIYDYLRLLYARVGVLHCPICGDEVKHQTVDEIVDVILKFPEKSRIQLLAPVVKNKKGKHVEEIEIAKKNGFTKIRVDGKIFSLFDEAIELNKNTKHNIEVLVDRLVVSENIRSRLTDSLEVSFKISGGLVIVNLNGENDVLFSQDFACPKHNFSIEKLTPQMFSFNNPQGACEACMGLGSLIEVSKKLIVPDETLSIDQGAIQATGWKFGEKNSLARAYYEALAKKYGFSLSVPFCDLPESIKKILFYGTGDEKIKIFRKTNVMDFAYETSFAGIINNLQQRYKETKSDWVKRDVEQFMIETQCPKCGGGRLKPALLKVTVSGKNIKEFCEMNVLSAISFIKNLNFQGKLEFIAKPILQEINSRLEFLKMVGLQYLTLDRSSRTLSGGESQRIRLATQIGSTLTGVLYILDEPSIGLHSRDNEKLINSMKQLRDLGNSVIVVEHDEETIKSADYVVEVGPKAGEGGGQIVFSGPFNELKNCKESLTAKYIYGKLKIAVPQTRREGTGNCLEFFGCRENNLKKINVKIKLGTLTCVTGVSGSGKSTLVNEIIYKYLASKINKAKLSPGKFSKASGEQNLNKIIYIDQSPIGKTPRSNPATYTTLFDNIRELFANTNYAKLHGFNAGRFSFNVKGGRCEACKGDGIVKIEMHFLPDIFIPCEVCGGKRYNRETLKVEYCGKNIYDVLNMTVDYAIGFFENQPRIKRKLTALSEVGLGYIKIGQNATTLSGGEAQRVKLAAELSKVPTGKTLYILDEMSTGLHTHDLKKMVEILHKLVDGKNTVLLIEHNLDVIKTADYLIDLGPEGGEEGGKIVAQGTPEQVAENENSHTGRFLKIVLCK